MFIYMPSLSHNLYDIISIYRLIMRRGNKFVVWKKVFIAFSMKERAFQSFVMKSAMRINFLREFYFLKQQIFLEKLQLKTS